MSKIKKVIIPVGGFGTRFLPATKAMPKEMLTVVDKPVIQYLVEEAVGSGIEEVIFVTNRNKRAIEDHFDHFEELEAFLKANGKADAAEKLHKIAFLAKFTYVRQKMPKGVGDAIMQVDHLIGQDEPVAVLYGDDLIDSKIPALKQLINVYDKYEAPVLSLQRTPKETVHRYGIVDTNPLDERTHEIKRIVEKPKVEDAPSNMKSVGKYIVTREILNYIPKLKPQKNNEVYLTDAFEEHLKNGGKIYGYEIEGEGFDCGDKLGFLKAIVNFGRKHPDVGKDFAKYLKGIK